MSTARSAIISGANGGIGRALCTVFRQNGWYVIGTDIHEAPQVSCDRYVTSDLSRFGSDSDYRKTCLMRLREELPKPGVLNALVNNAAIQIVARAEDLTASDWTQTLSINVIAPFLLVRGMLKELEAADGAVVNISSIHAQQTKAGFSAYATSKAALIGLTRSLAVELGGRVRVNAVCPAAVATPMLSAGFSVNRNKMASLASCHPSGTIGTPEEVARFVLMLASEESKYATGVILNLDGGISGRLFDPE